MCRSEIRKAFGIHAACQDRNCSVSTIRKLLDKAGPEVLGEKDVYGRVPLFYAIRRRCSLPVIRTLLDACPDAILEADFCGDLPLYMLFGAQIDPRVLQYVLEKNPSLALFQKKRFSGSHTLLQTICAQWVVQVRNRKLRANDNKQKKQNNQTVVSRSGLLLDDELLNRWRKLVLMVRAAHRVTSSIDTTIDRSSNSSSSKQQRNN